MTEIPLPRGISDIAVTPPTPTAAEVLVQLKKIQALFREDPLGDSGDDRALAKLKSGRDGVACFNYLYTVITDDIKSRITEGNFFRDNDFLDRFDAVFADRYFSAIRKYTAGLPDDPAPASWQLLFENRENPEISPLQFATEGVNAHVNVDLPLAVVEVCKDMDRELDEDTHHDFQKVNDIFYEKIPQLRMHFESPDERKVDVSAIRDIVNDVCDRIVLFARDIAWEHAHMLWRVWEDSPELARKEKDLDHLTSHFGELILRVA
jgi:hypothetical protein